MTPSIDGELLDDIEEIVRSHPETDPITSAEIADVLGIDDDAGTRQKTREAIRILVDQHRIAAGTAGSKGYYHIENSEQLEAEVQSLQSRAQSIVQRAQNLEDAFYASHRAVADGGVHEKFAEPDAPLDYDPPNPGTQSWEEIEDRPYPGRLDTATLRAELTQLQEAGYEGAYDGEFLNPDQTDSALARARRIWRFLEHRLDATYPECPTCDCSTAWGQTPGDPLHCAGCGRSPGPEVAEAVHDEWRRLHRGEDA